VVTGWHALSRAEGQQVERVFTLEYWVEDEWYVGRLKEVVGVFSQGETLEDLEQNIRDAYRMMSVEGGDFVPAAKVMRKELSVSV
jgi:hypothetical protein